MKTRVLAAAIVALLAGMVNVRAQTFTWTGLGADNNSSTPANWLGGVAPTGSGTEDFYFPDSPRSSISFPTNFTVHDIVYGAHDGVFIGNGGDTLTVNGDISSNEGTGPFLVFSPSFLSLSAGTHSITVNGGDIYLFGALAGSGDFVKSGSNTLTIASNDGASTYTGAIELQQGRLVVAGDGSLGTGNLTMNGGTLLTNGYDSDRTVTLNNNLLFTANTAYFGDPETNIGMKLTFNGTSTALGGVPDVVLNVDTNTRLTLLGNIGETDPLTNYTLDGGGTLIFGGDMTFTGNTSSINSSVMIFRGSPSGVGQFIVTDDAYLGTEHTFNYQVDFIQKFDTANTSGIIGFDSPDPNSPQNFSGTLDLSGFSTSVRIGTSTAAIFSGSFTPQDNIYRFGGRGIFTVTTSLADYAGTSDIEVGNGLLLYLSGTNTYTGFTHAAGAGVVFNSAGALPSGGVLKSDFNGYVGNSELTGLSAIQFLAHFDTSGTFGVIGFDTSNIASSRVVNEDINLSDFDSGVFIGSATSATFNGIITPSGSEYRFTGFREGQVIVNSILSDIDVTTPRSVVIGLVAEDVASRPGPTGNFIPSVTLNGHNTYTGGTFLQSGQLILGASDALGTGTLAIAAFNPLSTGISVNIAGLNVPNAIDFGSGGTDGFTIGGEIDFTLSGALSGGNVLDRILKAGNSTITLSGDNSSLSIGFTVRDGILVFASDTAAGNGDMNLINRTGGGGGAIRFTSGAPSMGNLFGEGETTIDLATLGALTIYQTSDGNYDGVISGTGGIVKVEDGSLTLTNTSTYSGTTQVGAGTLVIRGSISTPGSDVVVGFASEHAGGLNVVAGGHLASANGFLGTDPLGSGSVVVDGAGSTWTVGNTLSVGVFGSGDMTISKGGVVTSGSGIVGQNGANGSMLLKNAGSVWNITGGLNVGNDTSSGTFRIYDDAQLNVAAGTGTINLALNAGSDGGLHIGLSEGAPHGGIINAAEIVGGAGDALVLFDTGTTKAAPYYLTKDGTAGGAAVVLSGSLVVINQHGFNVLTGTNTYTGGTSLVGGVLMAGSNGALGSGTIYFNGGNLSVASGVTLNNTIDYSGGGILGGNGTFGGPITVGTNVALA
ncbi:MAG: Autotransporter-associated beta strand repeat protein, partial [Verrucomicrobia bacterium]|nr:Autotransporter-associated beta strand repeat protein [Verrucomicrobiota bacterium]